MSTDSRVIRATPHQVWQVLADGWLYALWVVGAARIRAVDDGWPAPGTRIHHSVGSWPLLLDDRTEVVESRPESLLRLHAHGWPAGRAEVTLHLHASGQDTDVVIEEQANAGPATLLPAVVQDPLLSWRNSEALRRLQYLVERRQDPSP